MTDNTGSDTKDNKATTGNETDSKTDKTGKSNVTDPKAGENTFDEKVFDDPRLWTHPRFKSLNERAKKADALEKAQSEAEEKRMAEAKKFEELATKRAQERDDFKGKFQQSLQDNRIIQEAMKIGVVDTDAVLKLIDRTNIHIDDNGTTIGVIEAVQSLVSSKPYLKGKNNVTIGSGTNPGADSSNNVRTFKLSQLQNAQFYRDNEKEIMLAYKAGKIEDDTR